MATYDKLTETGEIIANMIILALKANGINARIEKTYLDYGQNWFWDTIIVDSKTGKYQALNPRQFKQMNNNTFDYSEINEIIASAIKFQ